MEIYRLVLHSLSWEGAQLDSWMKNPETFKKNPNFYFVFKLPSYKDAAL